MNLPPFGDIQILSVSRITAYCKVTLSSVTVETLKIALPAADLGVGPRAPRPSFFLVVFKKASVTNRILTGIVHQAVLFI